MLTYIQKHRILLLHLAFWCMYFSFFFYQITFSRKGEEPDYGRALEDAIAQVTLLAALSYLNFFVFLPRFLKHRNFWQYILEFIVPFIVINLVLFYLKRLIYADFFLHHKKGFLYESKFIIQGYVTAFFIVSFVAMLKFAGEWFQLETKKKEIENEQLTAELRFLKDQINPHFLFNTLNNLYYLAFTNSPNTTEVIAKLSQMMRYMIYDSNHEKVPLSKEIEYLENYISLEKLRLNNNIPIQFEVIGESAGLQIVPFIFITFLENAFKHGVSNNIDNTYVKVSLDIQHGDTKQCVYKVENSKIPKNTTHEEKSGIGLKNVKRRLDLSYPEQYLLNIEEDEQKYSVVLKLVLS